MARTKTPADEKFEKQDFNLFEAIAAIDKKDYGYYDRLTPEQQRKFVPFMMLHWISVVKGKRELSQYYLQSVDYHANTHLFNENVIHHPKLQWLMLCAASPGIGKQYHQWIPHIKAGVSKLKDNAKPKDIKDYYKKVYPKLTAGELTEIANAFCEQHKRKMYLADKFPELKFDEVELLSELVTDNEIEEYEKNSATKKFGCDFCGRSFAKESTIDKHICEYKRRWGDKNLKGNRIGFNAWLNFYAQNTSSKKQKTYLDFTKSSYYLAFVKFGHYCVNVRCININRYADWLLKNQIRIDSWISDKNYTKFIVEYLRQEDPLDAIARSMETLIEISKDEQIESKDAFRYGAPNRLCYEVTTGRVSPWSVYQSDSGAEFLSKLDSIQQQMVLEYIDPEKWAIKFNRDVEVVTEVKELLKQAGY